MRIGAVADLNTRPLVFGIEQGLGAGRVELSYDVPAGLARGMRSGAWDVALLPVIELARPDELEIVPGLGITTRGPSRSVLLVSKKPLDKVRSVGLDPESRTSNALVQVLCCDVWGIAPRFMPGRVGLDDALLESDAAVRIGDKALFEPVDDRYHVHDLGGVWTEATGLPFVFAVWAARAGIVDRDLYRMLHESRRAGSKVIDSIAENYTWNGTSRPELAREYLRKNIHFRLGTPELQALRRFLEAAARIGLIDRVPRLCMALERRTACHEAVMPLPGVPAHAIEK